MRPPARHTLRRGAAALCAAVCAGVAGCGTLLPHGASEAASGFADFDAARRALEQVQPYHTTLQQLRELGFDVQASENVRLISYPEVVARVAPNHNVPLEMLDPGIRDCIVAQQACRAYEFSLGRQTRQRQGRFMADFFNFRRITRITGWRFEGLVVVRDELVLFRSYGGEPQIARTEDQVNPLGPLQPAGEAATGLLMR